MADSHSSEPLDHVDGPVSISHFFHTLGAYSLTIILSLASVMTVYLIAAITLYMLAPSQRVTSQPFRVDFDGASEGRYPNGLRFSSGEIVAPPILLQVFEKNHLERFTTFSEFRASIALLQIDPEYERLAYEYAARLAESKLSVIDRERIQREWQSRADALAKNGFTLTYMRVGRSEKVPETLARKVLVDILSAWAEFAVREEHVLNYRMTILSPEIITNGVPGDDNLINLQILRSKVTRVLQNVDELTAVPGAELVRTKSQLSLEDIRFRLEETLRFRIDPLMSMAKASGLVANPATTERFFSSQLAYDERELQARIAAAESIRQAIAVYSNDHSSSYNSGSAAPPADHSTSRETVMPQLSDTFMDRLVALTGQANDSRYRQKLVDAFGKATVFIIPAQQAVAYDREVLALIKNLPQGGGSPERAGTIPAQIAATASQVRNLVVQVNEVYAILSHNLNPSNQLYSVTAPPTSHVERTRSLGRLALGGVLTMLVALPLVIFACLIHARFREEETESIASMSDTHESPETIHEPASIG